MGGAGVQGAHRGRVVREVLAIISPFVLFLWIGEPRAAVDLCGSAHTSGCCGSSEAKGCCRELVWL